MSKNLEYEAIKYKFQADFDARGTYDGSVLENAIRIFCIEVHAATKSTEFQIASEVLAIHLMRSPDLKKAHRITMPCVFFQKDQMMTPGEKRRRTIAFQVYRYIQETGCTVDAALKYIASKNHVSIEKARQGYYENPALADMMKNTSL